MDTTHTESLWVFALASKCTSYSSLNFVLFVLLMALAWLTMSLVYWAHPGGPAWGKHGWKIGSKRAKPIPGPRGVPIVGSMSLMTGLAHRKLAATANSFQAKRLMAFSLAETRVIITCNADVAKEILKSSVFADRPVKESAYGLMFNRAIGFAPYGLYWRTLRRIASVHLFCPKQIKATETQRFQICSELVTLFRRCTGVVRVRDALKRASLNSMMWSVFGSRYSLLECPNRETEELRSLVNEGYELLGVLNWSDHLPLLSEFDLQKIRFRCSKLVPKVKRFLNRIISQHKGQKPESSARDFVDVLLSLQGPDKLSESDIVAVLWEMIFRGTDAVAVLIEWILARMLLHADVQSKVQEELDKVVGRSRAVHETSTSDLVYLQAVVKEVLRLHPPGPLLSWSRLSITDTTVDGCHVPAGTTAMVNMWAIARDPQLWPDPDIFLPERFLTGPADVEFSIMGSDLRLAPFGSGRRTCPGKILGLTTTTFWVATLLHEFEFRPSDQTAVDLSEVLRLSCEMASPLEVKVRPRRRRRGPLINEEGP
ncbi:Cytochrome P450, partial [Dillenia turbinata]